MPGWVTVSLVFFTSFSALAGLGDTTVEAVVCFTDEAFTGPGRSSIFCFRGGTGCNWDRPGRVAFGVGSVAGVVKNRHEWTDIGS